MNDVANKNVEDIYPLSPLQQGLFFQSLLATDRRLYWNQLRLHLRGDLDSAAFRAAWQGIIDRHVIFRTRFVQDRHGRMFQVVNRTTELTWQYEDLSDLNDEEREEQVCAYEQSDAPSLDQPPLTKIALFRLAANDHIVVWGYHHIILDGWSESIIWNDVWQAYDQVLSGEAGPLSDPVPYSAYIARLNNCDKAEVARFWADYLADFEPTSSVATITHVERDYREYSHELTAEICALAREFARTHRLTLTTLLQGTWAFVLGAWRGMNDVIFGSAINDRPIDLDGSEMIAGLMMATVAMRYRTGSREPVIDWLLESQSCASRMATYSGLTLGEIKAAARLPAGEALFDTLCALDRDLGNDPLQSRQGTIDVIDVKRQGLTEFPLSLTFLPGENIKLVFTVDKACYDADWCDRAFDCFERVLERICSAPESLVNSIDEYAVAVFRKSSESDLNRGAEDRSSRVRSRGRSVHTGMQGLDYWRIKLGGTLPGLDFPRFKPRPPEHQPDRGSVTLRLDSDLSDRMRAFSCQEGVDLVSLLLTGFAATLLRYCRQDEVIVGTLLNLRKKGTSGRDSGSPDVHCAALRLHPGHDWSFARFVDHVVETKREAQDHVDTAFEDVVIDLDLANDESRAPVFQALAAPRHENDAGTGSDFVARSVARTDLSCWFDELEDAIAIELEYASSLFEPGLIENFASHFTNYLDAAISDVEKSWLCVPMLGEREVAEQLARRGPGNRSALDQSVTELVWRAAEQYPEKIAITSAGASISYAKLRYRSSIISENLLARGVTPGSIIGLALSRTESLPLAMLAVLDTDAAFLPLDIEQPVERLDYALQDSGAKLIVSDTITGADLPSYDGEIVQLYDLELAGTEESEVSASHSGSGLAYVMYTSGSTGTPKGVAVGQREVVNLLTAFGKVLSVDSDDVWAAITTTSFDISVLELLLPLTVGAQVHVVCERALTDGRKLAADVASSGTTVMQGTPASWRLLYDSGWPGNPALTVLCGGEALPLDLAQSLCSSCGTVWNVYGPTETTVWSTMARLAENPQHISIGRPIQNTSIYIVDELDALVPDGVEGEILIAGDGVARGYLNKEELTERRFGIDPFDAGQRIYRTGDIGRWLPSGELEHRGRTDSQLKLRGFRIEAGDVENNLATADGVNQVAVTIRPGPSCDPRLVAFVVMDEAEDLDAIALRRHLRDRVPEYMIPQHFVEMPQLPLTHNRKVDYANLPQLDGHGTAQRHNNPPSTANERLLAKIWSDLIGVAEISTSDNFFELGGHSMLTIRAIASTLRETGVELQPQFFILEDLATIAKRLDALQKVDESPSLEPTRTGLATRALRKLFGSSR
jgi:amino acid adenylation domain-containing protein